MLVLASLLTMCWMLGSISSMPWVSLPGGVAEAFASGAEQALLYDSLKLEGIHNSSKCTVTRRQPLPSV